MNIPKKYHHLIAAIYSAYYTLGIFVLNPFVFLADYTPWVSYASLFALCYLMALGILKISARSFLTKSKHLLIIGCIFLVSLINGTVLLFLNDYSNTDLLLYYNSFVILSILPVSIFVLWLMYFDLNKRVVVSTNSQGASNESSKKLFRIINNRNEVVLETSIESIITFEANDNYVKTYYLLEDGSLEKVMYRISLKKITELLDKIEVDFFRVHKSYLINPDFIASLKGKSQAYKIELSHLSNEVPVSRTFDVSLIKNLKSKDL